MSPVVFDGMRDNRTPYAVDVIGGGRSSAMRRRMSPKGAAFQIAKLVEHEQRMIAGATVMAVPDAHLLLAVRRTNALIHVEHDASWRTTTMNAVDPLAGQIG